MLFLLTLPNAVVFSISARHSYKHFLIHVHYQVESVTLMIAIRASIFPIKLFHALNHWSSDTNNWCNKSRDIDFYRFIMNENSTLKPIIMQINEFFNERFQKSVHYRFYRIEPQSGHHN